MHPLQLTISSQHWFLAVCRFPVLGWTGPSESPQPLWKDGVREVVAGVHPVGVHGAQVLNLQFNEGAGELGGVSEFDGEFIYDSPC